MYFILFSSFFLLFLDRFQLGGIAMVVLGVSILYKYDVVLDVIKDSHAEVVPIVFIAIGSAIFLIAFFGCCGAIFESECMILTVSTIHKIVQLYDGRIICGCIKVAHPICTTNCDGPVHCICLIESAYLIICDFYLFHSIPITPTALVYSIRYCYFFCLSLKLWSVYWYSLINTKCNVLSIASSINCGETDNQIANSGMSFNNW